ncbi:pyridoxine 5'-phosphate synthase [Bacteroidia bacterium]|nr:pyridoxine 5'-phosphate synthase [Bacteroidia bacterium]
MTKLSVNINKIAVLRNSRGGDLPDVVAAAQNAERFGAQGITVHPRPDERHIRYSDVYDIKRLIATELNIEGNPTPKFLDMVFDVTPEQVTLVPDAPNAITSNSGWNVRAHQGFLTTVVAALKGKGIRTSIFINPDPAMASCAARCGADRIELYTEAYAAHYINGAEAALAPYLATAQEALRCGLGINAGHDLNLENLKYFADNIPGLLEVSIGHALISDAIYLGLENTIQLYLRCLKGPGAEL